MKIIPWEEASKKIQQTHFGKLKEVEILNGNKQDLDLSGIDDFTLNNISKQVNKLQQVQSIKITNTVTDYGEGLINLMKSFQNHQL